MKGKKVISTSKPLQSTTFKKSNFVFGCHLTKSLAKTQKGEKSRNQTAQTLEKFDLEKGRKQMIQTTTTARIAMPNPSKKEDPSFIEVDMNSEGEESLDEIKQALNSKAFLLSKKVPPLTDEENRRVQSTLESEIQKYRKIIDQKTEIINFMNNEYEKQQRSHQEEVSALRGALERANRLLQASEKKQKTQEAELFKLREQLHKSKEVFHPTIVKF